MEREEKENPGVESADNDEHTPGMSEQELLSRITISTDICHGKPCIRGLRYPVEFVLELLSSGMTEKEILADYEDLETADLQAVYAWAARLARTKRSEPLAV